MSDAHGVARDQLRAFIERIERLEEEKKTIADDIKDVYAEAKGMGFIPAMMKKVIALRKKDEMERMEEEAILDTYLHALGMIAQHDLFEEPTRSVPAHDPETGEILEDINPRLVKQVVDGMQTEAGRKALIAAVDIVIEQEEAEEQNSPETATKSGVGPLPGAAGADGTHEPAEDERDVEAAGRAALVLTNSQSDDDAFAEVKGRARLANVNDVEPSSSGQSSDQPLTGGDHVNAEQNAATLNNRLDGVSVQSADRVTFETCPRMPMKSLSYAHCFPELTKTEYQCLAGDIALNGVLEPIIRMRDIIVDGWNRYNAARSLGIEYPVRNYSGDDVLVDVISWQRAARNWTPEQERKIAATLSKIVPHRSNDIWAAFHLAPTSGEVVAA